MRKYNTEFSFGFFGFCEFNVMLYEVYNAPATYQRLQDTNHLDQHREQYNQPTKPFRPTQKQLPIIQDTKSRKMATDLKLLKCMLSKASQYQPTRSC